MPDNIDELKEELDNPSEEEEETTEEKDEETSSIYNSRVLESAKKIMELE